MHRLRPHIAMLLVLVATLLALPRNWVHACQDIADSHTAHGGAGTHDRIAHTDCPICDYAPSFAASPVFDWVMAPSVHFTPQNVAILQPDAQTAARCAALRGPPRA